MKEYGRQGGWGVEGDGQIMKEYGGQGGWEK